jgi:hypothetical protein
MSKLKVHANRPFFLVINFHIIQSYCKLIQEVEMIVILNTYPHHALLDDVMDGHALLVSVENIELSKLTPLTKACFCTLPPDSQAMNRH